MVAESMSSLRVFGKIPTQNGKFTTVEINGRNGR